MRPTFLLTVLVLVGLGCSNGVDEDNRFGSVSGRVLLEDSEFTIPKVEVSLREYTYKTVTNGKFNFSGIPAGAQEITAFKEGYSLYIDTLVVSGTISHDIRLRRIDSPH